MKDVLFVQGAGANVHADWDLKLVESLRRALGPGYDVRYPAMPDEADPSFTRWSAAIDRELRTLSPGAVVVGHSVGGAVLINMLAQSPTLIALAAIILIAAPFIGEGGWSSDDIEPRPDLPGHLPADVPVLLYHGEEDQTVPVMHVDLYSRALPLARVRKLPGRDHQLNNDLSEVAHDIQRLGS